MWVLIDSKTKEPVRNGAVLQSFRGEKAVLSRAHPPHKPSSSGHVSTTLGYHYPSVYGLEFIETELQ